MTLLVMYDKSKLIPRSFLVDFVGYETSFFTIQDIESSGCGGYWLWIAINLDNSALNLSQHSVSHPSQSSRPTFLTQNLQTGRLYKIKHIRG